MRPWGVAISVPDRRPPDPTGPRAQGRAGRLRRLVGLANPVTDRVRLLSLVEQALLSLANFLGLLLLARHFRTTEFGMFSFAYLSLMLIVNVQRSLVVVPFIIHAAETDQLAREGRLWRKLNMLVTVGCTAILGMASGLTAAVGGPGWLALAWLAAAIFVPASFVYEFFRRWAIQRHEYRRTVAAAGSYLVLFGSGTLIAVHLHSLPAAVAAFFAANAGAALMCRPRPMAELPGPGFRAFLDDVAHFLGWSLLSNLAYNGYYYLPPLILGGLAGPLPVAVFQAMRNFSQPLNMLGTAVDNFDKPRAARAMVRHGVDGMWRQLLRTTGAMAVLGTPYMLVLVFFGHELIDLVYAQKYGDHVVVLHLWVLWHVLSMTAYPLETGLFVTRRPNLLFRGRIVAAAIGIATTAALATSLGVVGAMLGLISGTAVSAIVAFHYLRRVRREADAERATPDDGATERVRG